MNVIDKNNQVIENRDLQNLNYILQNEQLFFLTGYKVLQNQEKNGFIKCVKISQNGKIKLVYDISNLKTLSLLMPTLTPEGFLAVLTNLIHAVMEVKNNGFMQCENIDLSFDKVFVDCNNYRVFLIYLPINTPTSENSFSLFETQMKNNIIAAIQSYPNVVNPFVSSVQNNLKNNAVSLEVLVESIQTQNSAENEQFVNPAVVNTQPKPVVQSNDNVPQFPVRRVQNKANPQLPNVNNQYVNQSYEFTPHARNKTVVKAVLIVVLQVFFLGLAAAVFWVTQLPDIIKFSILGAMVVVDVFVSVWISGLMLKFKRATVQYDVNFQPESEGGATELLDDIFIPSLILSGYKTPQKVEIVINKPEFTIGKNRDSVDGVIQFNQAISRVHCKFVCVENQYFLVDIGSSNGTFVNGARVAVNSQVPVKAGDRIKLANSEFVLRAI